MVCRWYNVIVNKLDFFFECLDGKYHVNACFDEEKVNYEVESNIDYLPSKSLQIDSKSFLEEINLANIQTWDHEYSGKGVEDACKWKVVLSLDNKQYSSKGEESFYPYNYEHLVNALVILDENVQILFRG